MSTPANHLSRVCAPIAGVLAALLLCATAGSASAALVEPPASEAAIAREIVTLARAELAKGVREMPMGSNNSPDITRYRSALTRRRGGPWCAAFTSYLAAEAGAPLGLGGAGIDNVIVTYKWARAAHRLTSTPRPGALILYRGLGHIGVVESVRGSALTTIEGNYSNRVLRRHVRRSEAQAFVRVYPEPILLGEMVPR